LTSKIPSKKKNGPYGEKDLYGNSYYGQLGLLVNLSNKVSLKVAYNYLNFSKTKYFQYTQFDNLLDSVSHFPWGYINNYHLAPTVYSPAIPYQVRQQELHLEIRYCFGKWFQGLNLRFIFVKGQL